MKVNEFLNILRRLRMDGHGDKEIHFGYDSNYVYTEPNGNYDIEDHSIFFYE